MVEKSKPTPSSTCATATRVVKSTTTTSTRLLTQFQCAVGLFVLTTCLALIHLHQEMDDGLERYYHGPPTTTTTKQDNVNISSYYEERVGVSYRSYRTTERSSNPSVGGIFWCGYDPTFVTKEVFGDYVNHFNLKYDDDHDNNNTNNKRRLLFFEKKPQPTPTRDDILVVGVNSPCAKNISAFPGKVLFMNGEPASMLEPGICVNMPACTKLNGREHVGDDVYQIGLMEDSNHSLLVFQGAWTLLRHRREIWPTLWDHRRKPKNSGKYNGVVYLNGHCVKHRIEAVHRMSEIMTVYHGSRCIGDDEFDPSNNTNFQVMPNKPPVRSIGGHQWWDNLDSFSDYKFCMAMENSLSNNHYMSEKIFMAFLAGCIPIYFGSEEVFNVFNKDAFVFYNTSDPYPALQKIQYLIQNETAYFEMLNSQPVVAHGEQTVNKFFSISDSIGDGSLKRKLRKMMDLPV